MHRSGFCAGDLNQLLLPQQVLHLGLFTSQANQQVGADVGMPGDAGQDAVEHLMRGTAKLQAASTLVRERHDAVDVRIVAQRGLGKTAGNVLADRSRTVDRRDHGDVVAGSRLAVAAAVTAERTIGNRRGWRRNVLRTGVLPLKLLQRQVVTVHPLSRRDVLRRVTNHLAILPDRLLRPDRVDGHFVAHGHRFSQRISRPPT